jgi:pyruvate dehydrogenase E1 component
MEWLLLDALARLADHDGESLYLRLSTKPVDQAPFAAVVERRGDEALRADVLGGGYWLREPRQGGRGVVLLTCGALAPEVLEAAGLLEEEGVDAAILIASSPDGLYRGYRADGPGSHLARLVPPDLRGRPLVTAIDGASHVLAALGGCLGMATTPLGVDAFGQSGSAPALLHAFGLSAEQVAVSALGALRS